MAPFQIALTETERVPPSFWRAAHELAQVIGLDAESIIAGRPMRLRGVDFWLQDYGSADPTGLVVMVEVGTLPAESDGQAGMRLLEQQFLHPVGVHGYYCRPPGTDVIAFCLRVDLNAPRSPSIAVLEFVHTMADRKERAMACSAT